LALMPFASMAQSEPISPEVTVTPLSAPQDSASPKWLDKALQRARDNAISLGLEPLIRPEVLAHDTVLHWPVRESILVQEKQIQYLSHHVDQDDSAGILDWNCGMRTYDGHNGTDIGIGPYAWYRMRMDQGIAIAAAPGTIVDKVDNLPEESCDTSQKDGNVVTIQHEDGSLALYAHIRTGSATHKKIGDHVYLGEYIGVIGSSGISSGPHLHFGIGFFENNVFVHQDPWDGACNNIGGDPWWEEQPPALLPSIMDVRTHSASPVTPTCPQSESPNFKDSFMPGDDIVFSVVFHDIPANVGADIVVRRPNNSIYVQTSMQPAAQDRLRVNLLTFGTTVPGNAASGEWTVEVTFNGETERHSFWVNASPPAGPVPTMGNNAFAGLWYDQLLSGEGFNVITSPAGTVIFFYGSDEDGNRLWLISETLPADFVLNGEVEITMYESTGGVWEKPITSRRGLSIWGTLLLRFTSCTAGTAQLTGVDGEKSSTLVKLAGIAGSNCGHAARSDVARSGLWYDTTLSGEGFNFIVTPGGVVIFYYGFDKEGNRLWLISDTITDIFEIGENFSATIYRAIAGNFDAPDSTALRNFGKIEVTVNSCGSLEVKLETDDGDKISDTVQLANVIGLGCP